MSTRLRWNGRWVKGNIGNISCRGLMIHLPSPPPPGTYVEIDSPQGRIVARSVWISEHAAGFRCQEKLDLAAMMARAAPGERTVSMTRKTTGEHGGPARPGAHWATGLQFAVVSLAGAAGGIAVAWQLYVILSAPVALAMAAMK